MSCSSEDFSQKFDPCRRNYMLDKLHQITEDKFG